MNIWMINVETTMNVSICEDEDCNRTYTLRPHIDIHIITIE